MNAKRFLLPLFLTWTVFAGAAQEPHVFPGQEAWGHPERVTVKGEEFLLDQEYTGDYMSRSFNFNGNLDDGTLFAIYLSQWRYGILSGWVIAFLAVAPDGEVFVYEDKLRVKQTWMAGSRYRLDFAEGSLEGEGGASRIRLKLEDLSCDLSISGILPPWKPGDGQAYLPGSRQAFSRLTVTSPWARASGRLQLGGRLMAGDGQCYADRTLHTYPLRDFSNRTYYFRTFSPVEVPSEQRWMLSLQVYETHSVHGSLRLPVLILARGQDWVFTTWEFTTEQPDAVDLETCPLPLPLRVNARCAGYELEGEFVITRLFHVSDIHQKLPLLMRGLLAAFIRRPVLYRLQGHFRGTLVGPEGMREDIQLPGQGNYAVFATAQ